MLKRIITVLLICVGCSACSRTYDYDLEVINNTSSPLFAVLVESEEGRQMPFGFFSPTASSFMAGPRFYSPSDIFVISWTDQEKDRFDDFGEKPFSQTLDTTRVPRNFEGVLQFTIEADNKVTYSAIPYHEYYAGSKRYSK